MAAYGPKVSFKRKKRRGTLPIGTLSAAQKETASFCNMIAEALVQLDRLLLLSALQVKSLATGFLFTWHER